MIIQIISKIAIKLYSSILKRVYIHTDKHCSYLAFITAYKYDYLCIANI